MIQQYVLAPCRGIWNKDDKYQPEPHKCHKNVSEICKRHPMYLPVRGWAYACSNKYIYAHSIVQSKDTSAFIDFTPPVTYKSFVPHCLTWTEELKNDYDQLLDLTLNKLIDTETGEIIDAEEYNKRTGNQFKTVKF